jgi:cytochrome bd-type quinol oxidase subunit 2
VLLTIAGIGIVSMVIALLYFSGVASSVDINAAQLAWNRLFFGFNYRILVAFGFFLLLVGLSPVLSVLDTNAKKSVKKFYVHLLFSVGIGIITLIYSFLVYGDYFATFDPYHTWFDYFIIAALLIIVGLSPILFSIQDRERLWNFKLFFALFIIVGLLLLIVSAVTYGRYIDLFGIGWEMVFLVSIIMLFLGMVPLLLTASPKFNEILNRLKIIWILGVLIGIVLLIGSYLVFAEIVPSSTVLNIDWLVLLAYGGLLTILTVLPLASTEQLHERIKKFRYIWLVTFLVGFLLVIVSAILVLPTSPEVEGIIGTPLGNEIVGVTWDIFYMYGTILTIVSLIFLCSILYYETKEFSGPEGLLESVEKLPDATSSEMVAYLEILSQSNKDLINQFKEAVRADKFRPRVYEKIIKQYQDRNRTITSRIAKFQKTGPEEMESLFEVALGDEPSQAEPSIEVSAPIAPPATKAAKSVPPPGPPTPPPKTTPPKTPPPLPSPGLPIPTPPTPLAASPLPTAPKDAPSQPTESPLDLIADARSTSIAELRGEMLKELRRLREIFKEE